MLENKEMIVLKDSLIIRKEDNVIFDFEKNKIIECNQVAFDILKRIEKVKSIKTLIEEIANEYDGDNGEIESAVLEFLEDAWLDGIFKKVAV